MIRRLALAALLALSPISVMQAQTPPPQKAAPAPPPEPPPPPYEPQLVQLAEIMGSLAYLRGLCGAAEAADWRERMAALLEAEGTTPTRRGRLAGAYNRGLKGYALTHRRCTAGSREAASRLAVDGERLARALAGRFGG